jgi:hypothetical protein
VGKSVKDKELKIKNQGQMKKIKEQRSKNCMIAWMHERAVNG